MGALVWKFHTAHPQREPQAGLAKRAGPAPADNMVTQDFETHDFDAEQKKRKE